jgi:hypothetical protein
MYFFNYLNLTLISFTAALRNHIDLVNNTRLRSIHLNQGNGYDNTWLDWIPMILAQIVSSQMEEACFRFQANDIEEPGVLVWAQVDHILGRFSTLERVTFIVNGMVDARATVASIKSLLPILETRGILRLLMPDCVVSATVAHHGWVTTRVWSAGWDVRAFAGPASLDHDVGGIELTPLRSFTERL